MKSMTKAELAKAAGVSSRTFSRWLIRHREELALLGVSPHAHLIPPYRGEIYPGDLLY